MRALDLFCGAGGVAMGLSQAGFDVVGIDIAPQNHYPFELIRGDAMAPPVDLTKFDLIWASPPCQRYSRLTHLPWINRDDYPDLIEPVRAMLKSAGVSYVIENVVGAPLEYPFVLCGTMFGLLTPCELAEIQRHRLFETSFSVGLRPPCQHNAPIVLPVVNGGKMTNAAARRQVLGADMGRARPIKSQGELQAGPGRPRKQFTVADARHAMGIDWMTRAELSQAIPPAYSKWIGLEFREWRRSKAA